MRKWLISLAACLALAGAGLVSDEALAQARSHIEKSGNLRLSGTAYATLAGLTYEQCEQRCLADQQCTALEHYRGGRVFGREAQCKLFSSVGETRANRFADIGIKRAGPGPDRSKAASAPREEEARKLAEQRRQDELRRAQEQQRRPQEEAERSRPALPVPPAAAPPPVASAPAPMPGTAPTAPAPAQPAPADRVEPAPRMATPPAAPITRAPPAASAPTPPMPAPIPPPVASAPAARPPAAEPTVAAAPPPPAASVPASETARPRSRGITPADKGATGASAPPASAANGGREAAAPPTSAAGPAPTDWDIIPVFYGTDRKRRDQARRIAYGSDRGSRLELGRALITVPKSHQVPNVERPWAITIPYLDITLYQESEDPKKHFTIKELQALSKDALLQLIRERLGASSNFKGQALVLVHGYNNGFDDALYRTAQVAYDLKFDGASFLYSWPSGSGLTSYPYDRDSAQQAEPYLTQFLQMVLNETGASQVSLIAHSMGNQPLLQVLRYLKQTNPGIASRINQIILAAPDVDRNTFEFLAEQIRGVGKGITMYASANDVALGISKRFAGGVPRAGDVPDGIGPAIVAGTDTIDVTGLSTEYLALHHSTYAEKTALIKDIELLIKSGVRPPEKRLPELERVQVDRGEYWRYRR